jgi:hypothetical protein
VRSCGTKLAATAEDSTGVSRPCRAPEAGCSAGLVARDVFGSQFPQLKVDAAAAISTASRNREDIERLDTPSI